jgi:hypothetical protein
VGAATFFSSAARTDRFLRRGKAIEREVEHIDDRIDVMIPGIMPRRRGIVML